MTTATSPQSVSDAAAQQPAALVLDTDVLVIGGGLAGTWAAIAAAEAGARVVLADKGYCGSSGVTAPAGPGHWWVPPDPRLRTEAIERRHAAGLGLADRAWMARALDQTWRSLPTLAPWHDFPRDEAGAVQYRALRGPEYLRALRARVLASGVAILDHAPALELLLHDDGSAAGALGLLRQPAHGAAAGADWRIRAGAVVLATGGCAFRARLLGADTNTGDGYLMAAEVGAELSGMEFSNYHTVAPVWSSMTRAMSYVFARYFDADGRELPIPPGPDATLAVGRALLAGPVSCTLDRMPAFIREQLPRISPNVLLSFHRRGIDPFHDRFEITLRGEGTVRGVGGLRIEDADCQTRVAGLFAAGDASSREPIAGAISGGGAQNSAWALSTGIWSGHGAGRSRRADAPTVRPARRVAPGCDRAPPRRPTSTRVTSSNASSARCCRSIATCSATARGSAPASTGSMRSGPSCAITPALARARAATLATTPPRAPPNACACAKPPRSPRPRAGATAPPSPAAKVAACTSATTCPRPIRSWPCASSAAASTSAGPAPTIRRRRLRTPSEPTRARRTPRKRPTPKAAPMIELVLADRCTGCDACVRICPTNVLDAVASGAPVIARQSDCQTCFMCELYCSADALYVAPDIDTPAPIDAASALASGSLGQYRRESGWDEWAGDPRYANEHWRMDRVFAWAREHGA